MMSLVEEIYSGILERPLGRSHKVSEDARLPHTLHFIIRACLGLAILVLVVSISNQVWKVIIIFDFSLSHRLPICPVTIQ